MLFSDARPAVMYNAGKCTTTLSSHTKDHHSEDGLNWAVLKRHELLDKNKHNVESKREVWSWQRADFTALAYVSSFFCLM